MNLNNIVSGAITAINPNVIASIQVSTGSAQSADGTRVPTFAPPVCVSVQVQELSSKDLMLTQGLNLQGETKSIYINGNWEGVVRPDARGGDIITLRNQTWLVTKVLENWEGREGWTKVLATLQSP